VKGTDAWRTPLGRLRQCLGAVGRRRHGTFTLEGIRLIERALRSGTHVTDVVAAERLAGSTDSRIAELLGSIRQLPGTVLHFAPDAEVERFTEGRGYGPILALASIPRAPTLTELLSERPGATLLVALDVQDPGNVGALSRTALACGANALVAVGVADPFHPKAVRTSMGSIFRLPILGFATAEPLLEELKELRVTTVGAVSRGGTPAAHLPRQEGAQALILGSEAFGIADDLLPELDHLITIPMVSEIDSLSVNAAAAILLYELLTREDSR
jgi:RNA methyltransferase, TrmH family